MVTVCVPVERTLRVGSEILLLSGQPDMATVIRAEVERQRAWPRCRLVVVTALIPVIADLLLAPCAEADGWWKSLGVAALLIAVQLLGGRTVRFEVKAARKTERAFSVDRALRAGDMIWLTYGPVVWV